MLAAKGFTDECWADEPFDGSIDLLRALCEMGQVAPAHPVRTGLWCRSVTVETVVGRLDHAWHSLIPGGYLWVLGPWTDDRYRDGYRGSMDRGYFLALAERCGFERVDYPMRELICLRRQDAVRWRIGAMREHDFEAVAGLFESIFGHRTTRDLWRWKYDQGRGQNIVCWSDGVPVAHYGGLSRRILYRGEPALACQIADVMVHSKERGVLGRKGVFFRIAASQSEASRGPHRVGYGFPNARHMAVAGRLGLYEPVGRLVELQWSPHGGRPSVRWAFRTQPSGELPTEGESDRLWAAMARRLPEALIGIRDAAWLDYRYRQHPHNFYHVHRVVHRITRRLVALVVTRQEGERLELVDFVGDPAHLVVAVHLLRRFCQTCGLTQVFCWFSAGHMAWFQPSNPAVVELDVIIPTSVWTEDPGPSALADRWWLMGGDTDFR